MVQGVVRVRFNFSGGRGVWGGYPQLLRRGALVEEGYNSLYSLFLFTYVCTIPLFLASAFMGIHDSRGEYQYITPLWRILELDGESQAKR